MARRGRSFRVGRVRVYQRGRIWYLSYHEHGERRRPRVGPDQATARQLAAQTNAQLEFGAPAPLSVEPLSLEQLRERWLDYHEHVLRSSVATIHRYRTATRHLLTFARQSQLAGAVAHFRATHAEDFATYLRRIEVASNGHRNSAKRPLRDKGIVFILQACRSLFSYAVKRRHLPPYVENPFTTIAIDRIPIEDARPFLGFSPEQERALLERCNAWEFPIFALLLLTGLRPGELTRLLLPDDLDLRGGWLRVRNKPELGWRVKTRNERTIPLVPELVELLRRTLGERSTGPVFLRWKYREGHTASLAGLNYGQLVQQLNQHQQRACTAAGSPLSRAALQRLAVHWWHALGAIDGDEIRKHFRRLTRAIGLPEVTTPKTLRHMFATALQDANVDPLIRNQLMGHAPAGTGTVHGGLAMTGVYTHSRPETVRRQLEAALQLRPALEVVRERLRGMPGTS